MKYMNLCFVCLFSTGLVIGGEVETQGLELNLFSMKKTQLAGELWDLRLFLVNNGTVPISVELGFLDLDVQIEVDGEWINCRQPLTSAPGVKNDMQWQRIEPGAELALSVNGYLCRKNHDPGSRIADWWEVPGDYALKVTASHRIVPHKLERSGPAPDGANDWTVSSNLLELVVQEPAGIDAEAFQWARKHGHHPVCVEVANEFPSSRYGALVVWQTLTIRDGKPEQLKEYIEKGFYPGRTSVPDASSPDGRRTINRGEDMARWRIEQGERLLREQKKFPYEREIRLSVAVSYAVLGERNKATKMLKALAREEGTTESQWAERFLALQGWQ